MSRTSFRFAPAGRFAACVASDSPGHWFAEAWRLGSGEGSRTVGGLEPAGPQSQILALDDGRLLLCQPARRGHEILLADANGVRRLDTYDGPALRLVEQPGPHALALAVSTDGETSTVWWVRDDAEDVLNGSGGLAPIVTVPGLLGPAGWLDAVGTRLGVNQSLGGVLHPLSVDLASRTAQTLWTDTADLRIVLTVPATGRVLVAEESGRLGVADVPGGPVRPLRSLDAHPTAWPLVADAYGTRVAVRVEDGNRGGLLLLDPDRDRVTEVPLPDGVVGSTASWADGVLRFPFAGPGRPAGLAEVRPGDPPSFRMVTGTPGSHRARSWRPERFAGPAGPVDTRVYGDWQRADEVVLAVQGGPDPAWEVDCEPLLRELTAAGLAVVTVDPCSRRGGSGCTVPSAWGGPDLADVHAVATALTTYRGGHLRLLGTGFGAFLAVMALGLHPGLWERAAVVAPFLSGPRLYGDAGPRLRGLLDRLGGAQGFDDELGPRDALQVGDRITAALLLVHGAHDDFVPVSHSRQLWERLRARGADAAYVELEAGHDPFHGAGAEVALSGIGEFLSGTQAAVPPRLRGPQTRVPDSCGGRARVRQRQVTR